MSAGSKITDTKQEYQYSQPFVTPSGHEFSFYDTPGNQRLVIRHTSGSHVEFKADGSVFIKAAKDLHMHSSANSAGGGSGKEADNTTSRQDTDYTWNVGGRLRIKCSELDFEVDNSARIKAGTDMVVSANNMINKATESISLEGTKSLYFDTKELRERVVSRQTESGTKEGVSGSEPTGGVNIMKVYGNTIIQNDDPNGGITIASKGYLNLVAGAERIDIVGKFLPTPSTLGVSTFSQYVFPPTPKGPLDKSTKPGDYFFQSAAGAVKTYGTMIPGSSISPVDGLLETVTLGNHTQTVAVGNQTLSVLAGMRTRIVGKNETVAITGEQTVTAKKIFLN